MGGVSSPIDYYVTTANFLCLLCRYNNLNEFLSSFRIAVVKHLLGLFDEAVLVYQAILSEHCDYVPALKGVNL